MHAGSRHWSNAVGSPSSSSRPPAPSTKRWSRPAPPEGKLAALRAYEADPYASDAEHVLWRLFAASLDLQDGVEAARWCDVGGKRFAKNPSFVECQLQLFALPGQRPDVARAWRLLDEQVALYPPNQRDYRRRRGSLFVAIALL